MFSKTEKIFYSLSFIECAMPKCQKIVLCLVLNLNSTVVRKKRVTISCARLVVSSPFLHIWMMKILLLSCHTRLRTAFTLFELKF